LGHFESRSKKMTRIAATAKYTLFLISMGFATETKAQFTPVDFPKNIGVSGFAFPAPTATIDKWVMEDDVTSMAAHAWGLWVGVNMDSGQQLGGQQMRIFETWNEKSELPTGPAVAGAAPRPRLRTPPRQRLLRPTGQRTPRPTDYVVAPSRRAAVFRCVRFGQDG
jgi:hypothetical protein